MELTLWQKKQATLLYHYASIDYLKPLHGMVSNVIKGIDITLQRAGDEGRDRLYINEQWGMRDTSTNWSTYGFPALLDLQKSVARQISNVAFEVYGITGVNNCSRTLQELSMMWATPDEEARFKKQMEAIARYARPIDKTMSRGPTWSDVLLYVNWQEVKASFSRIPQFRLREDVMGESGKKPPRTGVYAPLFDPEGSLQFAWTGNNYGQLSKCTTFNEMGLDAMRAVGHENLWNDSPQLLTFLLNSKYLRDFKKESYFSESDPSAASAFLSGEAFVGLPRKWVYVEMLPDTYEDLPLDDKAESSPLGRLRGEPNEVVPKTGWWESPAKPGGQALHYFEAGQRFPDVRVTHCGGVVWSSMLSPYCLWYRDDQPLQ